MKKLSLLAGLMALLWFACTKSPFSPQLPGYLHQVATFLQDSLAKSALDSLDYSRVVIATTDTGRSYYVRIPFRGRRVQDKFVLVKTAGNFAPQSGAIFEVTQDPTPSDSLATTFNGSVTRYSLNGILNYRSQVLNGYIEHLHIKAPTDEPAAQPYVELPEIIIYAPGEEYYADWGAILGDGGDAGSYGYSSSTPSGAGGGGGSASSAVNAYSFDVANELQASRPGIDLQSFLNCFGTISNDGATYTAALLVRIPNPGNPNILWNALTGNVGHTFIELTKTNGSQSISQYVGFYATCGVCVATGNYSPSKMVDNSGHPYDAKLTVQLTANQFGYLANEMLLNAQNDYSLGNYNCTNYAVDAFNTVLSDPLNNIPVMTIPGQDPGMTPNGLYISLENLPANSPDGSVNISPTDLTAGTSHGACN